MRKGEWVGDTLYMPDGSQIIVEGLIDFLIKENKELLSELLIKENSNGSTKTETN